MSLKQKKLFLLDMDGTIYLGSRLFDFSLAFFDHINKSNAGYIFLTNNSSKSSLQYIAKLNNMGIAASQDNIITSTHALIKYLKKHYGSKPIFASGTSAFLHELETSELNIINDINLSAHVLVMGFDTEITFQKLENMCIMLGRGVDYIATNPDLTCPTEYGYVPDCGSVAQILKNATGRQPMYIGKPQPFMVEMALSAAGVSGDDAIIIGDRLYTDVACGIAAGIDSVLVLSGESTIEDYNKSPFKPDYVFEDLGQLLEILKE